ncbi:amidohydrolase family protein [Mycobacterium intracellulare]|uniref:amidohydrolase family protein n=1 Tax=Mycobacterium intracellulare TaxID=1767 RepID=UPI00191611DB|nr:amidohydrolase family protein [Mycobacterium intracellulare]MCA2355801.1 amidohydrolase [Mycobacterium intracellulare]MCA2365951.1 amidohydrolase [Mycobacterium intracellulare]
MLLSDYPVIDADTHITEPPDTWTARMPSKYGDRIPHIERIDGWDTWVIDGRPFSRPGNTAMAGFDGTVPDGPPTYADMHPAAWDPKERIALMDELGIYAHVLYPNVGGFGAAVWLDVGDRQFALDCVKAFNDFQTDFASVAPGRLLPVVSVPFWDVEASVAEIERALENGHRGVNFVNDPKVHGHPPLWDQHWDPIWSVARDAGVTVNFHIGGGRIVDLFIDGMEMGFRANFSRVSSTMFADNLRCMAGLINGGVCHRFPDVNFVSVESGVGMIPAFLEAADWQWRNGGVAVEHPEYDLLPSEYFRRQIFGCFWYEQEVLTPAVMAYPDNMLFETDFPHPTSQHPSPQTPATTADEYVNSAMGELPADVKRKLLFENAAKLYKVAA